MKKRFRRGRRRSKIRRELSAAPKCASKSAEAVAHGVDVIRKLPDRQSSRPIIYPRIRGDALLGSTLISVLRQLRLGFPERPAGFPQSIALIGLRDVRDYRLEKGAEAPALGSTSPFNVKVESLTLRNFDAAEVAALCRQHSAATGQEFETEALERIFELTQGQPWLVNALARQIVEVEAVDRRQRTVIWKLPTRFTAKWRPRPPPGRLRS